MSLGYIAKGILLFLATFVIFSALFGIAFAEPNIHIDRQGIGGELTIITHEKYHSGKVSATIEKSGHTLDMGECNYNKRAGACAIAFKLTDGKYWAGDYLVKVTVNGIEYERTVWLWEKNY